MMKSKLLVLLLLFSGFLFAEVETEKIRALGYGVSANTAIQEALIESLKQRKGVNIDSIRTFKNDISEYAKSIDGQSTNEVEINKLIQSKVTEITTGIIHRYRIIENRKNSDNEWEAELEIIFKKYKTPGISPHSRRKIAIMPFRTLKSSYQINDKIYSSTETSRQFAQHLTNHIIHSRRFSVLDREYMDEYLKERKLVLSTNSSLDEQMKLGEVLGVDYMIVGKIGQASINKNKEYLDLIGETLITRGAEFNIDYRIIVMPTRQIKWSDTVSMSIDSKTMKSLTQNATDNVIHQRVMDYFAQIISGQLLANIFPLKIVNISQRLKTITLNQGGKSLKVGEVFEVMTLGEEMFDPYTKESLGQDEEQIAIAKILKVLPKFSKAKIIKGSIEDIQKGDIVRRKQTNNTWLDIEMVNPLWKVH